MSNKRSKNLGIFKEDYKTLCFFVEKEPGTFYLDKQLRLKSYFVAKETFNKVDEFCWQLRDGINETVENHVKFDCVFNLSKEERTALI